MERLSDGGDGPARPPATAGPGAVVSPGDAPRTVVVTPDQVWCQPGSGRPGPSAPEPAHQTFYAPLVLVVALSSVLLALALAALVLVLWVRR